jgi:hypothetical protein
MFRQASIEDRDAILDIAVASGLFPADETAELTGVLMAALTGELGSDHVWVAEDDTPASGVADLAPERITDGTWNIYMLAVSEDGQRQGLGLA